MNENNKQQTIHLRQGFGGQANNKGGLPVVRSYKDLIVYKLAKSSALKLLKYYSQKRFTWTERYLVDQLIRAAASIGANLAEGYGRLYKLDYRRFVSIARGSSFELEYWIDLVVEIRPQDKGFLAEIASSNVEVLKMLTGMMRSLGKQAA